MAELTEDRVREIVREELEKAGVLTVDAVSKLSLVPDPITRALEEAAAAHIKERLGAR